MWVSDCVDGLSDKPLQSLPAVRHRLFELYVIERRQRVMATSVEPNGRTCPQQGSHLRGRQHVVLGRLSYELVERSVNCRSPLERQGLDRGRQVVDIGALTIG